jgi:hypothetical protein
MTQKIGLFVGREWSFPPRFLEQVNGSGEDVIAEYVKVGGTQMDAPCEYAVIVDRISHEVPYYRSFLKNAVLQGTHVINNPFMWSADDKFFGASLVTKLGMASPKTIVLPNKEYVPGIVHNESLRNLEFPIPWEQHIAYLGGFPVILKDAHGGGWKEVYKLTNMEDLWARYNESGLLTMVLQEFIQWDNYIRCMCLDRGDILVMKYDPAHRRYHEHDLSVELYDRVYNDSSRLVQALGYDMNTVEWAIRDGIPYAIDFMNPAPDMDVYSLGEEFFEWCVTHMADMCIRLAKQPRPQLHELRWSHFF